MVEEKIKIKISRKILLVFFIFIFFIAIFAYFKINEKKPLTTIEYDGFLLEFRTDLREAQKVKVYPSEDEVYKALMNSSVKNVTIAFKLFNESDSPYYKVESMELVLKLYLGYKKINAKPNFNGLEIDSYEKLISNPNNPVIVLVFPSNETLIELKDHLIFLKAKDYHDFDLVTVKLIMIGLNITVE
jgi:hypothetical protein